MSEFNIGDKVSFIGGTGEEIDAVVIEKEIDEKGKIYYSVETEFGIPRIKFVNGKGLKKKEEKE